VVGESSARIAAGYRCDVKPTISRSVAVAAEADVVWSMVTDLPRMGEFSPENIGGRWIRGATGPAVGAEYRGYNRNGRKRWWTRVKVIAFEPGRSYTFDVRASIYIRVSRWGYEVVPTDTGCILTENWYRVGNKFVQRILGPRITGRADRPGFNVESIDHTLAAVKRIAEAEVQSGRQAA
jgi:hypothetical protein